METELNKLDNQIIPVFCHKCNNDTMHKILHSESKYGEVNNEFDDWFSWEDFYQIIQCQGCKCISFRKCGTTSKDYDENGLENINESLFPFRSKHSLVKKIFIHIPYNLRTIYHETIDCYNNGNLILSGAGIRAIVEVLCNENNIEDGEIEYTKENGEIACKRSNNLQGKINGLYEKNLLSLKNSQILHEHRFLGNKAVHEVISPNKAELKLAIEILEHMFDEIYEIPQKANLLTNERLKKQPTPIINNL
jgi:hypothetical protein